MRPPASSLRPLSESQFCSSFPQNTAESVTKTWARQLPAERFTIIQTRSLRLRRPQVRRVCERSFASPKSTPQGSLEAARDTVASMDLSPSSAKSVSTNTSRKTRKTEGCRPSREYCEIGKSEIRKAFGFERRGQSQRHDAASTTGKDA